MRFVDNVALVDDEHPRHEFASQPGPPLAEGLDRRNLNRLAVVRQVVIALNNSARHAIGREPSQGLIYEFNRIHDEEHPIALRHRPLSNRGGNSGLPPARRHLQDLSATPCRDVPAKPSQRIKLVISESDHDDAPQSGTAPIEFLIDSVVTVSPGKVLLIGEGEGEELSSGFLPEKQRVSFS